MFLTRFAVNPQRRGARKLLASPQAMHAAVLAGFPPREDQAHARNLWRVDRDAQQSVWLYILSPEPPDLTHLIEQAGWPTSSTWDTRTLDPLLNRLATGQRWAFRLTANPVHVLTDTTDGRKRRVAHVSPRHQTQWLLDKAARAGFAPSENAAGERALEVTNRSTVRFRRGDGTVTLAIARFDGLLEVTDVELFKAALAQGIGPAKAYGCGLMTLAYPDSR